MEYRREIDGLRALAVSAVVIFHAKLNPGGISLLPGGFLGVDIFFVISGYLITSIILRELQAGAFSIRNFYHRRARRILPAFLVVLLATLPFAWWLMIPEQLKSFAGSAVASLLFGSNFWFWIEDSYWAGPSDLKPLLHSWTLSVEEQFYVLFPLLLIVLWRFARKNILQVFILLFITSLALSQWGSSAFKDANFFLLPTRSWELLAGAMLAKLELSSGRRPGGERTAWLPLVGLCLILAALLTFPREAAHPSILTAGPVLGVCLIIWFARPGERVTEILGHRWLVGIGLVSYSLYLWHYPIFAFWKLHQPDHSNLAACGLILASVVLAALSYLLIERPARSMTVVPLKPFAIAASAFAVLLLAVTSAAYVSDGFATRYGSLAAIFTETGEDAMTDGQADDCADDDPSCIPDPANGSIILVGDSHAGVLWREASALAKRYGYSFRKRHLGSCPQIDVEEVVFNDCVSFAKITLDFIKRMPPSIIVYAVHWRKYQDQTGRKSYRGSVVPNDGETLPQAYASTFHDWIDRGHRIVLIEPGIETERNVKEMIKELIDPVPEEEREQYMAGLKIDLDYQKQVERADWERDMIDRLAAQEGILSVDPLDLFCEPARQRCRANDGKMLFILDQTHYSGVGTREIMQAVEEKLSSAGWIPADRPS